jgi:hypothetical protein
MRMRRQSGEGIMGCIVWLVLLAAIALVLIKMLPVKIASAELADFLVEQAKFAGRGTTAAGVQQAIYDKAVTLNLPVAKKDIEVYLTAGRIIMKCKYSVSVDLIVYTYVWEFKHEENRPIFII